MCGGGGVEGREGYLCYVPTAQKVGDISPVLTVFNAHVFTCPVSLILFLVCMLCLFYRDSEVCVNRYDEDAFLMIKTWYLIF